MNTLIFFALFLALAGGAVQAADTRHSTAPDTGLETWSASRNGVSLELTQITPDQARAFFLGRGFDAGEAEHYASACVFMTILRNEGAPGAITYHLAEWRAVSANRQAKAPKLKEDWLREWDARQLAQPRKIAFEWSQLPTAQSFEPGDWNQGMTTFALARGSRFDLTYRWTVNGRQHQNILKGVRCANDIGGN